MFSMIELDLLTVHCSRIRLTMFIRQTFGQEVKLEKVKKFKKLN